MPYKSSQVLSVPPKTQIFRIIRQQSSLLFHYGCYSFTDLEAWLGVEPGPSCMRGPDRVKTQAQRSDTGLRRDSTHLFKQRPTSTHSFARSRHLLHLTFTYESSMSTWASYTRLRRDITLHTPLAVDRLSSDAPAWLQRLRLGRERSAIGDRYSRSRHSDVIAVVTWLTLQWIGDARERFRRACNQCMGRHREWIVSL